MGTQVTTDNPQPSDLVKGLGLFDSTTLVIGSMIGSGVFIVAAEISRQVQSPGLFFLTWVISGLMTVIAAVSYGELAGMMPKAGGQYIYLREAYGDFWAFLFGWTRSLWPTLGFPLRMDALSGDSNRYRSCGGGCLWKISWCIRTVGFSQDHSAQFWDSSSLRPPHRADGLIAAARRYSRVVLPERAEHFWIADRCGSPKRFYGS